MSAVKTAARYFFSATVFTVILYLFNANDVLTTMAGTNIASIIIVVGFSLGAQLFAAIRLQQLLVLQDIILSIRKVLLIGLSAVFYGLMIPGGTVAAFAVRFVQLSRNARIEFVAAALVVDRIIATMFLVFIGIIAITFDQVESFWVGPMVTVAIISVGFFVFRQRTSAWMVDRLDNIASDESPGRLRRFGMKICKAFLNYSTIDNKQALKILAVSLLAHLCGCIAFYVVATSVELELSFLSICWIRSGLILSVMIPISIAGLGVREITAIGLLVPLGFGEAQAVGFSILIFLGTSVIPGLIGGIFELLGTTGRR
jgi:uncharacterized protein (TIRG00374 family)